MCSSLIFVDIASGDGTTMRHLHGSGHLSAVWLHVCCLVCIQFLMIQCSIVDADSGGLTLFGFLLTSLFKHGAKNVCGIVKFFCTISPKYCLRHLFFVLNLIDFSPRNLFLGRFLRFIGFLPCSRLLLLNYHYSARAYVRDPCE